ncbi:MAG: hypothetical protein JOZ69_03695 [Myxococcales bacterium]|nr:hypothetical protein [Myxococcales bacterium]
MLPFLVAADGRGCSPTPPGVPDGGACVSTEGGHCGGNTANPCACASGLVCTQGDGGLPFGDVGGTCELAAAEGGGSACVSDQGGPCGGNTAHPCDCAAGLVCIPGDSGLPFGDVGGTCEAPADAGDPAACVIHASDFDQSCASDSDCASVAEGNACPGSGTHCWCPSAAINKGALPSYQAEVAKLHVVNVCACVFVPPPCCVAGKCQSGRTCSDAAL